MYKLTFIEHLTMDKLGPVNIVYIVSFLDLCAVGLTFPLFSTYLKNIGASHFLIGLISSTYAGIQVLSGPLIGSWSDVRDRITVLKIILISCCILYGALGIPSSLWIIFLIRFLLGIFKHTQTLTKAILSDIISPIDRGNAFGRSTAYANLGFIIGPLIGGYLSEFKHGFMYVSFLSSLLFLLNFGIISQLPEKENKKHKYVSLMSGIKTESIKTIQELIDLDWKQHWINFLLRFLFGLSMTTYFSNQALYLKEKYDLSQKHIGYTISFYGAVGMFVAFFLNYINTFYKSDNLGYQRLQHYFALSSLCFLLIYFSPNTIIFLVCLVPLSVSSTVLRVVSMDVMLNQGGQSKRGSLSGASNSVMSVARFVSPLFAGIVGELFGEQSVILMAVVPTLAGTVLSYHLYKANAKVK